MKRLLPWLGGAIVFALFALSLLSLQHQLKQIQLDDVLAAFHALKPRAIWLAGCATLGSYILLSLIDWVSLKGVLPTIKYLQVAPSAFAGYAVSYTLGFSALTGSATRFRLLRNVEIDGASLAAALARGYSFFWMGSAVALGVVLTTQAEFLHIRPGGDVLTYNIFGATLILGVALILALCAIRKKGISIGSFELPLPSFRDALISTLIASLDWVACGSVLYFLIPSLQMSFPEFIGLFIFAQLAGVVSHVPGGLGVFENVLLAGLGKAGHFPSVVSGLVLFRAIYYMVPLAIAGLILLISESKRLVPVVQPVAGSSARFLASTVPSIMAVFAFVSGIVLLTSGATPEFKDRLLWMNIFVPLSLIEASHFAASLVGLALLILSRGLWLRIRSAYVLTCFVLIIGAITSILKGFDYEEAGVLLVALTALVWSEKRFYRPGNIYKVLTSPGWLFLSAGALAGTAWLVFFAHKHVQYSKQLWWEFALEGHASRALRALGGTAVILLGLSFYTLFGSRKKIQAIPTREDLDKALPIVRTSPHTYPWLALLGDKDFVFSETNKSFIMYGTHGRSFVALGDPVGDPSEYMDLCWNYREIADREGMHTVFYQVGAEYLSNYVDLGLTLLKLGEEALVDVQRFSLEGGSHAGQRRAIGKMEKEGVEIEIIQPEEVQRKVSELQAISDSWLRTKSANEKGFSLGRFIPEYVEKTPCAIVRKGGRICAFANMWVSDTKQEFSVDLMRYGEEAPKGVMEFLFLKLILWGKEQGYGRFNLGMAPLSGLESHPLAPLWHRVGAKIFSHGEHFYNFQGLRQYKEKFDPIWVPRYMASPGGLALPTVVANVTSLISGGLRGVFAK